MRLQTYLTILLIFFSVSSLLAQVKVKGYYRKDGTYVKPHYRSSPDGNPYNNYSYPGNYNPYTGKTASGNPDTYLKNYYGQNYDYTYTGPSQVSISDYSSKIRSSYYKVYQHYNHEEFANYVDNLCNVSYKKLEKGKSYTITNQYNYKTGTLKHSKGNYYSIYDNDYNLIGIVETNRSGHKYRVYNHEGLMVNKSKGRNGWIWGVLLGAGAAVLVSSQIGEL